MVNNTFKPWACISPFCSEAVFTTATTKAPNMPASIWEGFLESVHWDWDLMGRYMTPVEVKGRGEFGLTGDREGHGHWRAVEVGNQGDYERGMRWEGTTCCGKCLEQAGKRGRQSWWRNYLLKIMTPGPPPQLWCENRWRPLSRLDLGKELKAHYEVKKSGLSWIGEEEYSISWLICRQQGPTSPGVLWFEGGGGALEVPSLSNCVPRILMLIT